MSTRSHIAYLNQDDYKIHCIYCQHDGYLSYNGKVLLESKNSYELAKELVEMGDTSGIDESMESCKKLVYAEGNKPKIFDDEKGLIGSIDCFIEFTYLFRDGKWFYIDGDDTPFVELIKEAINKEYEG